MKKHLYTIFLILIFFIGLSLLLYPAVSNYWNSFHQSCVIADYDTALDAMTPADYTAYFAEAENYNSMIRETDFPLMNYDEVAGYDDILNIGGNGIMGYISIPKIQVELPIYHGTSEKVLQEAVGHLQGTSLPVGGENTHSVLSAHRGLPRARLFTDLDKMEISDLFTITVLDRTMTYQVDQILIVNPREVEALYVTEGKDYCTLITCTPYGINTHRMLVRGSRIENPAQQRIVRVTADAVKLKPLLVAPFVATPMLLLLLIVLFLPKRRTGWEDGR